MRSNGSGFTGSHEQQVGMHWDTPIIQQRLKSDLDSMLLKALEEFSGSEWDRFLGSYRFHRTFVVTAGTFTPKHFCLDWSDPATSQK